MTGNQTALTHFKPRQPDADLLPPQNPDAERAVLSACLLNDADAIKAARDLLPAEAFYSTAHRHIWTAICSLSDRNEPADQITVAEQLRSMDKLDEVGGPLTVMQLAGEVGTSVNAEYHARLVRDAYLRRWIINRGAQLTASAHDPTVSVEELLSAAAVPVDGKASEKTTLPMPVCVADVQDAVVEWLWYPRVPIGFLTAIEGDPGEGKSFIGCAMATAVSPKTSVFVRKSV